MNIQKYIEECYEVAQSKGFYPPESKIEDHLMGIVSEIGEAYEAHRNGKFAGNIDIDYMMNENLIDFREEYKVYISGTFEDEVADIFIRLFNLCGWLGIDVESDLFKQGYIINRGTYKPVRELLNISNCMDDFLGNQILKNKSDGTMGYVLSRLECLCENNDINIEKHIQAKIEYNKTREYLHGKKY